MITAMLFVVSVSPTVATRNVVGAMYTIRRNVLVPRILEGIQAGSTELWLGDATDWWLT
jgi:hypothetical protein